jgi:hypothetical protein
MGQLELKLLALHRQRHFGRSAGSVAADQLLLLLLLLVALLPPWMCGLAAQVLLLLCSHLQHRLRTQRQTVLPAPAQHLQVQHSTSLAHITAHAHIRAAATVHITLSCCKVHVRQGIAWIPSHVLCSCFWQDQRCWWLLLACVLLGKPDQHYF